jgi:hypothetical protein
MLIAIAQDASVKFIHNDAMFLALKEEGTATVQRASHVEPTVDGLWEADMSPVNGPLLGPYTTRQEALDKEILWLEEKLTNGTDG